MRITVFTSLFGLLSVLAAAQPKENNPFSQFGLGSPAATVFANQTGMGGLSTAWNDPFHLNFENPASLAALRATAFEIGIFAQQSRLKSPTASLNDWRGGLGHLAIGFPLKSPINEVLDKKKSPFAHGMGFALTPFSSVGYSSQRTDLLPGLGQVVQNFEGEGGLYQFRWGNAIRHENLSFGANIGWIFGKLRYESWATLVSDSLATFVDDFQDDYAVQGFNWNLGVQYTEILKKNTENQAPVETLTFGFTGTGQRNLNANGNSFRIRARSRSPIGELRNPDTLAAASFDDRTVRLPAELAFGMMYTKVNRLKIGFQYSLANWTNYLNEARPARLRDGSTLAAGLEWIPNWQAFDSYAKRMRYRTGVYFKRDPRSVGGKQLDDLGFSVGFGLPVTLPRQGTSFVNFAFEVGKLGRSTPISDSYLRMSVGFTLNDNSWFFKRRFE